MDSSAMESQPGGSGVKTLKIWSLDKSRKKAVLAETYEQLCNKCQEKFETEEPLRFCLQDGTEIDNEFFSYLENNTILFMLVGTEQFENEGSALDGKLLQLIEKIDGKRNLKSDSKKKMSIKMACGWFHFCYRTGKYVQMKSTKNKLLSGGTVSITFDMDSSYEKCIELLCEHFFPKGKNDKGKLSEMECGLGTAKGSKIPSENFSFPAFIRSSKTQRLRIYLLTKNKISFSVFTDSSDSGDSDLFYSWKSPDELPTSPKREKIEMSALPVLPALQDVNNNTSWSANMLPQVNSQELVTLTSTIQNPYTCTNSSPHVQNSSSFRPAGTPTVSLRMPDDTSVCPVCYDRKKDAVLFPCGHSFCSVCAIHFAENSHPCPICRQAVSRACCVNN